ncbi:MAG: sporulation transcriptional regulator SpoIIID [Clostridia bacterium]|nr:sporulation transcriptional regulator SpoIIID [Clostridia bacterium]
MYNDWVQDRTLELAHYILETHDTVRGAAKKFGISKSTVHKDVTERLEHINAPLFLKIKAIMEIHKDERHIRGGIATKEKYLKMKNNS